MASELRLGMRNIACPLDVDLEDPNGLGRTEHEVVAIRSAEATICDARLRERKGARSIFSVQPLVPTQKLRHDRFVLA